MNRKLLLAVGTAMLVGLAVLAVNPAAPAATAALEVTPGMSTSATGQDAFATDLYARVRGQKGNVFFSPYSISTALTMAWAGTGGQTAQEMAVVLHLPAAKAADRAATIRTAAAIQKQFTAAGGSKFQLNVANALWGQRGYPFKAAYLRTVRDSFDGGLETVDFRDEPVARRTINKWVEVQTKDKIKDLIGPNVLVPSTRLVLTNAIYFKAAWASQFKVAATKKAPFHLDADKTVDADMMNQTIGGIGYAEADGVRLLELPYEGRGVSMVILLPVKQDGLANLEQSLTADKLAGWLGKLQGRLVHVSMPKFKTTTPVVSLRPTLQAMGMSRAFDAKQADFSGMSDSTTEPLYIGDVIHKAFVDMNEEGTEAAAATATVGLAGAHPMPPPPQPIDFIADHPFVYLIRDKKTGDILFLGRLADPAQ